MPHLIRTDAGDTGIDHFQGKADAIFGRLTAVSILAVIDWTVQELLHQIAIGTMDLYAIESGRYRVLGSLRELADDTGDLTGFQRTRLGGFNKTGRPILGNTKSRSVGCLLPRAADRGGASRLERGVAYTANMPNLG